MSIRCQLGFHAEKKLVARWGDLTLMWETVELHYCPRCRECFLSWYFDHSGLGVSYEPRSKTYKRAEAVRDLLPDIKAGEFPFSQSAVDALERP